MSISESLINRLPAELQNAQRAISNPDVIKMIQALSQFGLGVCMPHAHGERDFEVLPLGTIAVERNQIVTFEPASAVESERRLPVAWRWDETGGVGRVAECYCCSYDSENGHRSP